MVAVLQWHGAGMFIKASDIPAMLQRAKCPDTLYHMVWECQSNPGLKPISSHTYEQWEDELASSYPNRHLWLTDTGRMVSRTTEYWTNAPTYLPAFQSNKVFSSFSSCLRNAFALARSQHFIVFTSVMLHKASSVCPN